MPTNIIMPALELAQETGKVVHWLKRAGDTVRKGEPIVEIETDKITVEIEAPASGVLRDVTAQEGDVVPVGRTIAIVVGTDEAGAPAAAATVMPPASAAATGAIPMPPREAAPGLNAPSIGTVWRIMAERMTASWTTAPHFYLVREVDVSRLVSWLDRARRQTGAHVTYTDLLIKLVAAALSRHPRVNASST